jgi:hypothetical protein
MRISSRLAPVVIASVLLSVVLSAFVASSTAAAKTKSKSHKARSGQKAAKGKTVKLTGGTIELTLTPAIASELEGAKVTLAAVAPATGEGASVTMPITAGKLDTASGDGTVVAGAGAPAGNGFTLTQRIEPVDLGGFELGGGEEQFSLNAPVTVTIGGAAKYGAGTGTNLSANVNGSATPPGPFFTLKVGKPKSKGSSITIASAKADLTSAAAEALDSFDGLKLTAGQELATITVDATT